METFTDIIALWAPFACDGEPDTAALARDLKAGQARVIKWKQRNSIPAGWWAAVVAAARQRGLDGVTTDRLTEIAARARRAA